MMHTLKPGEHGPIAEELFEKMNLLGRSIDVVFNGEEAVIDKTKERQWGFILLAAPIGDTPGVTSYIANIQREDAFAMLKEFVGNTEGRVRIEDPTKKH